LQRSRKRDTPLREIGLLALVRKAAEQCSALQWLRWVGLYRLGSTVPAEVVDFPRIVAMRNFFEVMKT
jgi:hypothetical protein